MNYVLKITTVFKDPKMITLEISELKAASEIHTLKFKEISKVLKIETNKLKGCGKEWEVVIFCGK